jgi:hypothetical protein
MKFKVGDEVRVVKAIGPEKQLAEPHVGQTGTIERVHKGVDYPYRVDFGGSDEDFSARELELIPKAKRRPGK